MNIKITIYNIFKILYIVKFIFQFFFPEVKQMIRIKHCHLSPSFLSYHKLFFCRFLCPDDFLLKWEEKSFYIFSVKYGQVILSQKQNEYDEMNVTNRAGIKPVDQKHENSKIIKNS